MSFGETLISMFVSLWKGKKENVEHSENIVILLLE
jgi:hypothetical protein